MEKIGKKSTSRFWQESWEKSIAPCLQDFTCSLARTSRVLLKEKANKGHSKNWKIHAIKKLSGITLKFSHLFAKTVNRNAHTVSYDANENTEFLSPDQSLAPNEPNTVK